MKFFTLMIIAAALGITASVHAQTADVSITKTDGVAFVTAGGGTTYTITASNAGPSNASGATVADTFPAVLTCTWTCVGAGGGTCTAAGSGNINDTVNLPAGGSVTYTASCTISGAATGTLSNTATVAAPGGVTDPNPGNNSATDTDTIQQSADLSITKTDGVTNVSAGGSATYTITASNAGPSNVSGATVADTFPAVLTCTWTCVGAGGGTCGAAGSGNINSTVNMPNGGSVTFTASCTISGAATGTISNTATVSSGVTDPSPANNSATDTDVIQQSADLAITKTDGVVNVTAGGSTIYTITAANAGPSNASGATVADTFPAVLTCTWTCVGAGGGTCTAAGAGNINDTVNLPSGGSVTYTASCSVSASATGTLANTATVTAPGGVTDPSPANNSATDTDTIVRSADTTITLTDGVTTVSAGGSTTYTITVSNSGPSASNGATVIDTFPAALTCTWTCVGAGSGTCAASGSGDVAEDVNLPPGGSVTFTASCAIAESATGSLSNTATVAAPAGVTDPNLGNNSANDTNTIIVSADIHVSFTNGRTHAAAGENLSYTLVVTNTGTTVVDDVTITNNAPAALENVSFTCTPLGGASCAASGTGSISETIDMPIGSSVTYIVTATVAAGASGTLTNTASAVVTAAYVEQTPGDNTASDIDALGPYTDLQITKTNNVTTLDANAPTTYVIVVTNAGPAAVSGAHVEDVLPATLTGGAWTCVGASGATCTAAGSGNINDNTVDLPVSASVTYTVNATNASTGSAIVNTATVSASLNDTDLSNNTASDSDAFGTATPTGPTGTTGFDVALSIKASSTDPVAGDALTYTATLKNNGPGEAQNVVFTVTLPMNVTVKTTPAQCTVAGAVVTCTAATLAEGAAETFAIVVTVGSVTPGGDLSAQVKLVGSDANATNNNGTAIVRGGGADEPAAPVGCGCRSANDAFAPAFLTLLVLALRRRKLGQKS